MNSKNFYRKIFLNVHFMFAEEFIGWNLKINSSQCSYMHYKILIVLTYNGPGWSSICHPESMAMYDVRKFSHHSKCFLKDSRSRPWNTLLQISAKIYLVVDFKFLINNVKKNISVFLIIFQLKTEKKENVEMKKVI